MVKRKPCIQRVKIKLSQNTSDEQTIVKKGKCYISLRGVFIVHIEITKKIGIQTAK